MGFILCEPGTGAIECDQLFFLRHVPLQLFLVVIDLVSSILIIVDIDFSVISHLIHGWCMLRSGVLHRHWLRRHTLLVRHLILPESTSTSDYRLHWSDFILA